MREREREREREIEVRDKCTNLILEDITGSYGYWESSCHCLASFSVAEGLLYGLCACELCACVRACVRVCVCVCVCVCVLCEFVCCGVGVD